MSKFFAILIAMNLLIFPKQNEAQDEPFTNNTNIYRNWNCKHSYPSNCNEAIIFTPSISNIYAIQSDYIGPHPFLVACERDYDGGGWTIIQRRIDGSIEFFRNWNEYKIGFGNLAGEFWIGLDKLHALTTESVQELLIVMEDFNGNKKTAKYDLFAIGNESEMYALKLLGKYSGDAGDSLTHHASYKFSTQDKNNYPEKPNCAQAYKAAWWYTSRDCHKSNLNGLYLHGEFAKDKFAQGAVWEAWRGYYYSYKFVQMMIRPKRS